MNLRAILSGTPRPVVRRGDPRVQYHRRYVLYYPELDRAAAAADLSARWEAGELVTGGWSADDGGIGNLDERTVLLTGFPAPQVPVYRAWYEEHYPGVEVVLGDPLGLTVPIAGPYKVPYGGTFGAPRKYGFHEGLDLTPTAGPTLALAAAPGVVRLVGYQADSGSGGYGIYAILDHEEPRAFSTTVAHMATTFVAPGQPVRRGQPLGEAGATGYATGVHVHLSVQDPGRGWPGYVLPDVLDPAEHMNMAAVPPQAAPFLRGVDVSHHQGTMDWAQCYAAGARFAFIRVGYGTDPDREGPGWLQPAQAAGLLVAPYQYYRVHGNPVAQADYLAAYANDLGVAPVVDLEEANPPEDIAQRVLIYLERLEEQTGRRPIVYTRATWWNPHIGPRYWARRYPLWVAHYTTGAPAIPYGWYGWSFWQHGQTNGASYGAGSDKIDLNWFHGDEQALQAWLAPGGGQ